ncbi:MAG: hypothetical protein HY481_01135 [Candidatus Vogelbacteria bacterium]|nr:hypothetical protein [Candidatus Vogelbacteria bacterium]
MVILPDRHSDLTNEERDFNGLCEFEEGGLYVFPEEIEARSLASRLDNSDSSLHSIRFREAIFLYTRVHHDPGTGEPVRRDHLFVARSREQVSIAPLVFAKGTELPRRISFFP